MKWLIIFLIKLYWFLKPKNLRRKCIFHESCSNYVYRITIERGFWTGLNALKKRFRQCRGGYQIYICPEINNFKMHLHDGNVVSEEEISSCVLKPFSEKAQWMETYLNR